MPAAIEIGRRKKELCAEYGFEGLYPFDNAVMPDSNEPLDRLIYRANVAMIGSADGGIFNLTPFRGPSADVGTVFELGLFTGLGKPAFAYTNDGIDLRARMARVGEAILDPTTQLWNDRNGWVVEDFGNADNLMIDACLAEQGADTFVRRSIEGRLDDLEGFVACLARAAAHFGLK